MINNNLPAFIKNQHHKEQIKTMQTANNYYKEISETLKADVELAKQEATQAKKDSKFSKCIAIISIIISIVAIVAPFFY